MEKAGGRRTRLRLLRKLHGSEADAVAEAEEYTTTHFPNLNDDPPLL